MPSMHTYKKIIQDYSRQGIEVDRESPEAVTTLAGDANAYIMKLMQKQSLDACEKEYCAGHAHLWSRKRHTKQSPSTKGMTPKLKEHDNWFW